MSLLLALFLSAIPQDDPTLTSMPEGWLNGKKSGWDGDYPPGWEKRTEEEKEAFLKEWNEAKFRYIKYMQTSKGNPTGSVTGILFMFKAVNGGVAIKSSTDLAMFGQNQKLKEPDFKIMMRSACSVYGTEVPHGEMVNIVKDLVTTGLRGTTLEQSIKAEIAKKNKILLAEKAKKEREKKENEGKDKKE